MDTSIPNPPSPDFDGTQGGVDPGEVLEQTEWLRRLAFSLVSDEAVAADLVQDALGSLQSTGARVTSVRGYLAGTVRNLAGKYRRGEARRRKREEARAIDTPTSAPSTEALAERIDTLRACMEELRSLAPAQQRALSLRYLEGLSPVEIAKQDGIPATTVRSHIARGLAALREKLDQRLGGRDVWCAVLVPWIGGAKLAATASMSGLAVPAANSSAAKVAWGPSSAFLQAGVIVMYLKALSLLVVPIVAVVAWAPWDSNSSELQADALAPLTRGATGSPLAPTPGSSEVESLANNGVESERQSLGTESVEEPAVAGGPGAQIRIIDKRTGEAVPGYTLELQSPDSAQNSGREMITDEDGHAWLPVAELDLEEARVLGGDVHGMGLQPAAPIELNLKDRDVLEDVTLSQTALDLSDPGAVPVAVGPTFRLALSGDLLPSLNAYVAYMDGPGLQFGKLMSAGVRGGEAPWVRLPHSVSGAASSAEPGSSWTLHVVRRDGLGLGQAKVTRTFGIEPSEVLVTIEPRGALWFRMPKAEGGVKFLERAVQLTREDIAYSSRFMLQGKSGRLLAEADQLRPGTYEWRYGSGDSEQSGSIDVIGGGVVAVDLEVPSTQGSFDLLLTVDTTDAPDEEADRWSFWLYPIDDPTTGVPLRATQKSPGAPRVWEVAASSIAPGRWAVRSTGPDSCVVEPSVVTVSASHPTATMTITALGEPAMIEIVVVDTETGEPIHGAHAMHVRGTEWSVLISDETGTMSPLGVPRELATSLLIGAEGYKIQHVQIPLKVTSGVLPVALEPGWGSRVWVRDAIRSEGVQGLTVHVDGVLVGKTDERGEVWLDGTGPPERIEVGRESREWDVAHPDFESGLLGGAGSLPGYVFTACRK